MCTDLACKSYVKRTIWDGDQILIEKRMNGASGLSSSELDYGSGSGEAWGDVLSVRAHGIDQPIAVRKPGHTTVVPHPLDGRLRDRHHRSRHRHTSCNGASNCPLILWPGSKQTVDDQLVSHSAINTWWGTLITEKTDSSGYKYMRNRYYNPQTGQSTQQDPIGLAGGMNLYGFADGDPVNFDDPFGLNPAVACVVPAVTPACLAAVTVVIGALKMFAAAALGGTVVYADHARGVGRTNKALEIALDHVEAAMGPPPGGGEDPHWKEDKLKQAQKHINNARKYVRDTLGRTRRELDQRINEAQKRINDARQPATINPAQ